MLLFKDSLTFGPDNPLHLMQLTLKVSPPAGIRDMDRHRWSLIPQRSLVWHHLDVQRVGTYIEKRPCIQEVALISPAQFGSEGAGCGKAMFGVGLQAGMWSKEPSPQRGEDV